MRITTTSLNWQLGGLNEPRIHYRNWHESPLWVPDNIKLGRQGLLWNMGKGRREIYRRAIHAVEPQKKMLDNFVALSGPKATEADILRFAKQWGVLGICKHAKPASHRPLCDAVRVGGNYWEPFLAWAKWSTQARLILNIAAELNQGRLGKSEDWGRLDPRQDPLFSKPKAGTAFRTGLDGARARLALIVNSEWVDPSALRFSIHPVDQGWTVGLFNETIFGLFGALGAYLMLTISGSSGITYCSNCGELYSPQRAPRSDRDNFCSDCGKKAKNRLAVRRFRARASSLVACDHLPPL